MRPTAEIERSPGAPKPTSATAPTEATAKPSAL